MPTLPLSGDDEEEYTPPQVCILDANILLRLADASADQHQIAHEATRALRSSGMALRTVPQSLFEFWVVATRPQEKNGLGLTISQAETFVELFTRAYWPIPDDPAQLTMWRRLVARQIR